MKLYDEFVAVSKGIIEPFQRATEIFDKKITAIPNYIDAAAIVEKSKKEVDLKIDDTCYNVASMGRLCHQKGFDILLDNMTQVIACRRDIRLYILGDGPERKALEEQIKRNKLDPYVVLLGNKSNPFPYLNMMDGFVLTSRYEGQGMVLLEAKALGLEIFMPRKLEKYNENLEGRDDIVDALLHCNKKIKEVDMLEQYNFSISSRLNQLLSVN